MRIPFVFRLTGAVEAALVVITLVGGSLVTAWPIALALDDSALVRALTLASAHVSETMAPAPPPSVVEVTSRRLAPAPRS